jgi:formylmethanofuran dehydrogenase subunit E
MDDEQSPECPRIIGECSRCGNLVFDDRHVVRKGKLLCRFCAEDIYGNGSVRETADDCGGDDETG